MRPPGWFGGPEHAAFELTPESAQPRGGALLLHGFGGTPAEMRPLVQALVERGRWELRFPRCAMCSIVTFTCTMDK